MECPNCRGGIRAGWKACPSCGNKLPERDSCPSCGKELDPALKACAFCAAEAEVLPAASADIRDSVVKEVHQRVTTDARSAGGAVVGGGIHINLPVVTPQTATQSQLVVCPACGRRNKLENVFLCRKCGKDDLCLDHFDRGASMCSECAAKEVKARADEECRARKAEDERGQRELDAAEARRRAEDERRAVEREEGPEEARHAWPALPAGMFGGGFGAAYGALLGAIATLVPVSIWSQPSDDLAAHCAAIGAAAGALVWPVHGQILARLVAGLGLAAALPLVSYAFFLLFGSHHWHLATPFLGGLVGAVFFARQRNRDRAVAGVGGLVGVCAACGIVFPVLLLSNVAHGRFWTLLPWTDLAVSVTVGALVSASFRTITSRFGNRLWGLPLGPTRNPGG